MYSTSLPAAKNAGSRKGTHLMPDHVYILISITPKYSVSEVLCYLSREKITPTAG